MAAPAAAQTALAPFRVGLKEVYLYDIPSKERAP